MVVVAALAVIVIKFPVVVITPASAMEVMVAGRFPLVCLPSVSSV